MRKNQLENKCVDRFSFEKIAKSERAGQTKIGQK